jgi:hypothetical protein
VPGAAAAGTAARRAPGRPSERAGGVDERLDQRLRRGLISACQDGGMHRLLLSLGLVATLAATARADDQMEPSYSCKALPASTKISVEFKPETTLYDLTAWVIGFTCKNVVFSTDVVKYATKITVVAPQKMNPKQALQLFVDAVESTGLVVVQKPDTLVIKLGPKMPRGCPDGRVATVSAPISTVGDPVDTGVSDAQLDAGIKVIDPTHREITRDLLDRVLANPMAAAKGARVVPAMKNGKPNGFKLYAIRPGSLYSRLGLVNGDTLVSVSGMPLDSADKALEVYTKLRDATTVVLQLERGGKPATLTITFK